MPYNRTVWVNNNPPPISAEQLNKIEQGIYDAQATVDTHAAATNGVHGAPTGQRLLHAGDRGVANGLATLNASSLVVQDSVYSSGVAGFTPTTVKAALDTLARAEHATTAVPAFRAYQNVAQSIPAYTWTKVAFQTEVYDQGNVYDNTTYRFTAPSLGIYLITARVNWDRGSDGERHLLSLFVNGVDHTRLSEDAIGAATWSSSDGSVALRLNAGDYVEVFVYTDTARDTFAEPAVSFFTAVRLA